MEKGRAWISEHHLLASCRAGGSFGIRELQKQKICKWDFAGMNKSCAEWECVWGSPPPNSICFGGCLGLCSVYTGVKIAR